MSGHLCLKWNNHSSAFLKSITTIHTKEKYCDATIVCQGKYFPVHRVVLSTCSDYFDEMFERMQCQHPYIVFKDIEPKEMELLLNYMYQGEVNVVQENLPTLIKAAEALKIKGLAVPDDLPSGNQSAGRKRSNTNNDTPLTKRRAEERKKRRDQSPQNSLGSEYSQISSDRNIHSESSLSTEKIIKEEPLDTGYADSVIPNTSHSDPLESHTINKEESIGTFVEFPVTDIKPEPGVSQEDTSLYEGHSSGWSDYPNSNIDDIPPPDDMGGQDDDMGDLSIARESLTAGFRLPLPGSMPGFMSGSMPGSIPERTFISPTSQMTNSHQCPYCDFKSAANLQRHIMFKHTKVKPFPCQLCPSRFALKTDLQRHALKHTGEKPFSCPNCKQRFRYKGSLKKHTLKALCITSNL